ncbi:MAG: 4Fe-4S dicluster domain-containing protein, partial [Pseudomonadota bacterium]
RVFSESLERWRSGPPLVFEPFAYESLKAANKALFGLEGLASYRLDRADFLVSFGADFLETWLSPVEYARKFKEMHSLEKGRKALFFHISPYQSLTGANADRWLPCSPGSEAAVALGLARHMLRLGRGRGLQENLRAGFERAAGPFTRERTLEVSGLEPDLYDRLCARLPESQKPLILGAGTGGSGAGGARADAAVNLLNRVLDPDLTLLDFEGRHRVEIASRRSDVLDFFRALEEEPVDVLLLNNVNPVFSLPPSSNVKKVFDKEGLFVVSFSSFMDETTKRADLILPVQLPLETWDEYAGKPAMASTLQPAIACLTGAPGLGDLFLRTAFEDKKSLGSFVRVLYEDLLRDHYVGDERSWVKALRRGGVFDARPQRRFYPAEALDEKALKLLENAPDAPAGDLAFMACPSIRFFDGRGANRPWLCEVPDPLTRVAWQTPILMHPETLRKKGLKQGDVIEVRSRWGSLEAPVYETEGLRREVMLMSLGQGHEAYGRYAEGTGLNPNRLLPPDTEPHSGAPLMTAFVRLKKTGSSMKLAHTDGSRIQHGRKIALSMDFKDLSRERGPGKKGLSMWDFPLALPLPEGTNRDRDIYPPHEHEVYRWAMVVDLDRCIGCGACATACYAENNIAVAGMERILEGREMAWLSVERYHDPGDNDRALFLPMMCQHCDNAPCESVCPVYAPHHSKEGLNNQIYNRCIGTRFCSQNCPYKVRRFNWFEWKWPGALKLQLNPDVTVRSKGVMEKCSFCIQRIKEAHGVAKDENRKIMDGEIQPACLQTCPTGVFTFGNIMDPQSRVRKMVEDRRAYQIMGYLNTKPAVIYLRKVLQES